MCCGRWGEVNACVCVCEHVCVVLYIVQSLDGPLHTQEHLSKGGCPSSLPQGRGTRYRPLPASSSADLGEKARSKKVSWSRKGSGQRSWGELSAGCASAPCMR